MRKKVLIAVIIIVMATIIGIALGSAWDREIHRQDRPAGTYIVYELGV